MQPVYATFKQPSRVAQKEFLPLSGMQRVWTPIAILAASPPESLVTA